MTKKPTAKPAPGRPATKKTTTRTAAAKKATTRSPAAKKVTTRQAPKAAEVAAKSAKAKKEKLVRDSFTMPASEYALLAQLKKACLAAGLEIKKSELLRIGVAQLATLDARKLQAAQAALVPVKAGRPKKHK